MTRIPFFIQLAFPCVLLSTACMGVPSPLAPGQHGSIGFAYYGVLTEGMEIPAEGAGFRCYRKNGKRFGTPNLVKAIQTAASKAATKSDDSPLLIGDLSAQHGGGIAGHASHRTGRDADLLFFYTTPGGVPIKAPGFVRVQPDGLAYVPPELGGPNFVRFDIKRSWALVKALLESPYIDVQWLFVSQPVEALLIEYARAKGEDPTLLWHAENVLQQPAHSLPHDDHFHLRIACSPEETVAGCLSGAPQWPWFHQPPTLSVAPENIAALVGGDEDPTGT